VGEHLTAPFQSLGFQLGGICDDPD
jgi:hypothetical protein